MSTQLGLDGGETPHPVAPRRRLSDRQRELVLYMKVRGETRPVELGRLMHAGREDGEAHVDDGKPMTRGCCKSAGTDGYDALRRLERRGLVEHVRRGRYRLVAHSEEWAA